MGNLKFKKRILMIVTMLALLLSGIAGISNSHDSAEAFSACKAVGSSMGQTSAGGMFQGAANADVSGREWTAEELFRGSVSFSSFYGEGPGTWLYAEKLDRGSHVDGYDSVSGKLEEARGFSCVMNFNWIPNMFIGIASLVTGFVGSIILMLVGKDPLAEVLTTIVGGTGNGDDGLIGTFMNSFYMPLILIAVIIMVVTIIYKGLIQMKFREALSSLIWSLGAFIIGVMLMLSPQMLAGIPQAATSTITTCVLGALSGQNCLSGDVETPSMLAGRECMSSVSDGSDSESVVNSLNCTIWKSFTLEPWAEVQFGAPYNELYTKNPPEGGDTWSNLPEGEEETYCVNLASNASYDSSMSGTPKMDLSADAEVCNVALYHLFLKTRMIDTVSNDENNYEDSLITDDTGEYDGRWYDIIVPMAGDESRWNNWSGQSQFGSRLGTSLMGLIAIIASSTVLLTLAVFAGAYKVTGLILMAFAPVFFLFAVEPTRGRRIFLGWLETLVSSILKYFAITVLIIVALIMYAGLLSNTSGVTSLIGIIILTAALHMYRKEIVDLIGVANMGGERLSNRANDFGKWAGKQTKEKGSALVGGAIGGALGSRKARKETTRARNKTIKHLQDKLAQATTTEEKDFYQEEIDREKAEKYKQSGSIVRAVLPGKMSKEERMDNVKGALRGRVKQTKDSLSGSSDSFKRSMKRGTGAAANIFQQADRTKIDMKRQADNATSEAKARRERFEANRIANEMVQEIEGDNKDNSRDNEVILNNTEDLETTEQNDTKTEEQRNIEVEYEKARKENKPVDYKGELTQEEIEELDKFAKTIGNSQSDQELMDLIRSDEVMNDRNKEALVANEIKARINANLSMGTTSIPLQGATPVERGEISREEFKVNEIERNFNDTKLQSEADEILKDYNAALKDIGVTGDEAKQREQSLIEQREAELERKQAAYNEAVEFAVGMQAASISMIQRRFKMGFSDAKEIIDTMKDDGIISEPAEDGEPHTVNIKSMDEIELPDVKKEVKPEAEDQKLPPIPDEIKGDDGNKTYEKVEVNRTETEQTVPETKANSEKTQNNEQSKSAEETFKSSEQKRESSHENTRKTEEIKVEPNEHKKPNETIKGSEFKTSEVNETETIQTEDLEIKKSNRNKDNKSSNPDSQNIEQDRFDTDKLNLDNSDFELDESTKELDSSAGDVDSDMDSLDDLMKDDED